MQQILLLYVHRQVLIKLTLKHRSIRIGQLTMSAAFVRLPVSLITAPVRIFHHTVALMSPIIHLTRIIPAIKIVEFAFSRWFIMYELSIITAGFRINICTKTMAFISKIITFISVTVRVNTHTAAFSYAVDPHSLIPRSGWKPKNSVSVSLAIGIFTLILMPGIGIIHSFTVRPFVNKFTLVAGAIWIRINSIAPPNTFLQLTLIMSTIDIVSDPIASDLPIFIRFNFFQR